MRAALSIYRNLPIRGKLTLVLNLIILVPLVTINFISYRSTEDMLKNKSVQYSQDILRLVGLRLRETAGALEETTAQILSSGDVYKTIEHALAAHVRTQTYDKDLAVASLLNDAVSARGGFLSTALLLGDGSSFYANSSRSTISLEALINTQPQIYAEVRDKTIAAGGAPVWHMVSNGYATRCILLARAVYHHDTFNRIGTLIMVVDPQYLSDAFDGLMGEDMRSVRILARDGLVILESVPAEQESAPVNVSMLGKTGWRENRDAKSLLTYAPVRGYGWTAVSDIALDRLYRDAYELRRTISLATVLAVVFMSLMGLLMSVDIVGAISKLAGAMQRVRSGESNVQLELGRKDELGFMGEAFNRMTHDISALEQWVYRERLTRREAELKALQSQINPHFLFNTLETVNWMAILGNAPEISKTITALASLMEAGILRGGVYAPLDEELRYIDNFIFILTKRFEDRLEMARDIEPDALKVRIPKLLIQPLVENAVYHGVENSTHRCVVTVTARVRDGLLYVAVEDNGTGIDEKALARINERLAREDLTRIDEDDTAARKSVGLDNVNQRIKLFYGVQYGLRLQSERGQYTRAVIEIPVLPDNPAGQSQPE